MVVLTRAELAKVIKTNPYPDEPNPKLVHAIFLTGKPTAAQHADIEAAQAKAEQLGSRDTVSVVDRTLFLHTPDGYGKSVLAELLARGRANTEIAGTARNWATVVKLGELLH